MPVSAVMRRDAYPDQLTAKVGAETKTLKNLESAITRQTEYLKNLTVNPKKDLERLKKELEQSQGRLAAAEKALAAA